MQAVQNNPPQVAQSPFCVDIRVLTQEEIQQEYMRELKELKDVQSVHSQQKLQYQQQKMQQMQNVGVSGTGAAGPDSNFHQNSIQQINGQQYNQNLQNQSLENSDEPIANGKANGPPEGGMIDENNNSQDDGNDNPLAGVLNNQDSSQEQSDDKDQKFTRNGGSVHQKGMMMQQQLSSDAQNQSYQNGVMNHDGCGSNLTAQQLDDEAYSLKLQQDKEKLSNIVISVKNVENLDEFNLKTFIEPEYIPKLQKWIEKHKFKCVETIDDVKLQVQIFNFSLRKTCKTDTEVIKEEMVEIKTENLNLMRDMKLFQHYFFNFWKERSRESLLERPYLVENIIESPQNLYNICEGIGYVEIESYNGKMQFFIGFRQPVPFLYHTGNSRNEEMMMSNRRYGNQNIRQGVNQVQQEDWFEVFISGKGFPHNLANISSKTVKQIIIGQNGQVQQRSTDSMINSSLVVGIDQQMLYLHKVDINVARGQTYTIYTPKLFS